MSEITIEKINKIFEDLANGVGFNELNIVSQYVCNLDPNFEIQPEVLKILYKKYLLASEISSNEGVRIAEIVSNVDDIKVFICIKYYKDYDSVKRYLLNRDLYNEKDFPALVQHTTLKQNGLQIWDVSKVTLNCVGDLINRMDTIEYCL